MRRDSHQRDVERTLRDAVKRDRARTKILRTSPFGLIEMTRQRIRPSLKRSVFKDCPCCTGTGLVKTAESLSIEVLRMLMTSVHRPGVGRIVIRVSEEVASYLNNNKRQDLVTLEKEGNLSLSVLARQGANPEHLEVEYQDANGNPLRGH